MNLNSIRQSICCSMIVGLMLLGVTTHAQVDSKTELVDFDTQMIPLLTKLGCNSGACHGSAAGRGGFRLSLYGSKPAADYEAIARQYKGRRINLNDAEKSLILRKPGGELDHGGQQIFELDDPAGQLIAKWIEQGAKRSGNQRIVKLDVGQASVIVNDLSKPVQLSAYATFHDGRRVNVTRWTRFEANDRAAIKINEVTGQAKILRRGRLMVIARFVSHVVPIEFIVPLDRDPVNLSKAPQHNFIDRFVYRKLRLLRLDPTELTGDDEFLRRVSLDLTGRLPTLEQIKAFRNNRSKNKRTEIIDQLMASEAYVDYWSYRLARQLRIRSLPGDKTGVKIYYQWLRQQLEKKIGWDKIAYQLVTARGDSHRVGSANFYRTTANPKLQSEFLTESLLGVRLRCANCHDHPLDRWTQDDYHGLAAILATTSQGRAVVDKPNAKIIHPVTGRPAIQRIPGQTKLNVDPSGGGRDALAQWIVHRENPYFAKAMVNRIWASFMGRGLIDPVDDLRATNPPTHPKLLERLTQEFVEHDFDLRFLMQLICNSAAYQRKTGNAKTLPAAKMFYAVASVRTLPTEVVADAIDDVTGVPQKYQSWPAGVRAVQVFDPNTPAVSLDILGRCSPGASCESSDGSDSGGLAKQLHLLNGELINQKLAHRQNRLRQAIKANRSTTQIVKEFYLRSLGRAPKERELKFWRSKLDHPKSKTDSQFRQKLLSDFVWSLLTCREFLTNH